MKRLLVFLIIIGSLGLNAQTPNLAQSSEGLVVTKSEAGNNIAARFIVDPAALNALRNNHLDDIEIPHYQRSSFFKKAHYEVQNGIATWWGDTAAGNRIVMTIGEDHFYAHYTTPHGTYFYTPSPVTGAVDCYLLDPSYQIPKLQCSIPAPEADTTQTAPLAKSDDGTRIDVMIYYNTEFTARFGGGSLTRLQHYVSVTNEAFTNSEINTSINLVHTEEVNYASTNDIGTALDQLTNNQGVFAGTEALRTEVGADQVTLVRAYENLGQACGVAWILTGFGPTHAYAVVESKDPPGFFCTEYTYTHELGHNMGCAHDVDNAGVTGRDPYSFGYQEPGGAFHTIMAYSSGCTAPCPEVGYFSNPNISLGGIPTGTASADNARTINASRVDMAAYRTAVGCAEPAVTAHPQNSTDCVGGTANYSVTATGDGLTYQWQKDNVDLPGETNATLTLSGLVPSDAGDYRCVITGTCGSITSNAATQTLRAATVINSQPESRDLCLDDSVTLTVNASGNNLSYQWTLDGDDIPGATSASLPLNNVTTDDAGTYRCVVNGTCGNRVTDAAVITVSNSGCIYHISVPSGYESWWKGTGYFMCDDENPNILTYVRFFTNDEACP